MSQALHHAEIQLAAVDIDMGNLHANQVAQPKLVAAARPRQAVRRTVEPIKVVG
jgi:hypothetical protein